MKYIQGPLPKRMTLGLSVLALALVSQVGLAQSVFSESLVGVSNQSVAPYISSLDFAYTNTHDVISASATHSFTGLDSAGNSQTMTFSGYVQNQSNYGSLHCYATGTVTNPYYNASNPVYYDYYNNTVAPDGSPDALASLGFAGFTDELQFGGVLLAGYQARYIFHVDGTNTGSGTLADMSVTIGGDDPESFFAFEEGPYDNIWATQGHLVNGITPDEISVMFSNQFSMATYEMVEGQTYSGTSDFSSTLTLAGIEMLDANGNSVSGWTVTSASGTQYNMIQPVPEPATITIFLGMAIPAYLRKRRRSK